MPALGCKACGGRRCSLRLNDVNRYFPSLYCCFSGCELIILRCVKQLTKVTVLDGIISLDGFRCRRSPPLKTPRAGMGCDRVILGGAGMGLRKCASEASRRMPTREGMTTGLKLVACGSRLLRLRQPADLHAGPDTLRREPPFAHLQRIDAIVARTMIIGRLRLHFIDVGNRAVGPHEGDR